METNREHWGNNSVTLKSAKEKFVEYNVSMTGWDLH